MKNNVLPSKDRQEWRDLLTGKINVPLKNFFFQMKITQARNQIKSGKYSLEEEVDKIYSLCKKFIKAKNMDVDIANIFGDNINNESFHNNNESKHILQFEHDDQQYIIEEAEKKKALEAERKKREIIEQLKIKEGIAKKETEKKKLESERIRLEAQKVIQEKLEALKREKREIINNTDNIQYNKRLSAKKKIEKERQKLSAVKKKKNNIVKKKSFFGSFFDNLFRN